MLFASLIASLAVVLVANIIASHSSRGGMGGACLIAGFCVVFSLLYLHSLVLMLNSLLIGLAALGCLWGGLRPQLFRTCSLAATAISYILVSAHSIVVLKENANLRQAFPLESVADRLAYETGAPVAIPEHLNSAIIRRLETPDRASDKGTGKAHTDCLEEIHKSYFRQFINSPGFTVGRRILTSKLWKYARDPVSLPLPPLDYEVTSWPDSARIWPVDRLRQEAGQEEVPTLTDLEELHEASVVDFVNARGFGYVQDRNHVAGFQVHHFRDTPELWRWKKEPHYWQVARLELVSLLRQSEPAVYLSPNLPRMDELREAKTRPVDAFEREMLKRLRSGQDVAGQATQNRIRLAGAIWAPDTCVRCHQVPRGALLGAFLYDIRRRPPAP
jgi:hypothetical protein